MDDGRSGAGWVIYLSGTAVRTGRTVRHSISTAFNAEALALRDGLRDVLSLSARDLVGKPLVLFDNQSVGDAVDRSLIASSQSLLLEAKVLLQEWRDTPCRLGLGSHDAEIVWVPGHEGFEGNQEADTEARAAAASRSSSPPRAGARTPRASLAGLRQWARNTLASEFRAWWAARESLAHTSVPPFLRPLLGLLRAVLGLVLANVTGHDDFAQYHERFGHDDAETQCQCGRDKALVHLAECRHDLDSIILRRDDKKRRLPLATLLTTKEGYEAFGRW